MEEYTASKHAWTAFIGPLKPWRARPQIEIYEESKYGNIYASLGESWGWEVEDWGPDDIVAPTCAACQASAGSSRSPMTPGPPLLGAPARKGCAPVGLCESRAPRPAELGY